ncbi:MAG: hypothetical protein ACJASX_001741 [Limisphaerales bacterium]|jgi:hypothetical protein
MNAIPFMSVDLGIGTKEHDYAFSENITYSELRHRHIPPPGPRPIALGDYEYQ